MNTIAPESLNIDRFTDKYFTRVRKALEFHKLNPIVTYRCFMRVDTRPIYKFVSEYLAANLKDGYAFTPLAREGEFVHAKDPLFELTGRFQDLVQHETTILQRFGWASQSCYNAARIRAAAPRPITLIDMAARHCPGTDAAVWASYAAHVGGFDVCSTDAGSETFGDEGKGTMPHAWVGLFPTTAEAAVAYAQAFPNEKVSILVDYYGQELDDAVACYKALGDKLASVRIDTHGGRFCQGVTNTDAEGTFAAITRLRDEFGVDFAGQHEPYAYGRGVTIEAAYVLRQALDQAGAKRVGITVSSGFSPEKVSSFVVCRAPVTSIGTGSFLPVEIRDTYATMDIVAYDGQSKIKVGREWLLKK